MIANNREKVPKAHIDRRTVDVKPLFEELPTRTKRDDMPNIIKKMARDHRKSIIGEVARRERRGATSRVRRVGLVRRRFMAP